jgi:hypothetical protein
VSTSALSSGDEDQRILSFDSSFLDKPCLISFPSDDLLSRLRTVPRCCELCVVGNVLNSMMSILAINDVPLERVSGF